MSKSKQNTGNRTYKIQREIGITFLHSCLATYIALRRFNKYFIWDHAAAITFASNYTGFSTRTTQRHISRLKRMSFIREHKSAWIVATYKELQTAYHPAFENIKIEKTINLNTSGLSFVQAFREELLVRELRKQLKVIKKRKPALVDVNRPHSSVAANEKYRRIGYAGFSTSRMAVMFGITKQQASNFKKKCTRIKFTPKTVSAASFISMYADGYECWRQMGCPPYLRAHDKAEILPTQEEMLKQFTKTYLTRQKRIIETKTYTTSNAVTKT